jgi:hypothetical protein
MSTQHTQDHPQDHPEEQTMRLPFLGSPASHFLFALVCEAAQITIYITCQRNLPSATGGLVLCNILLPPFMLAYMNSLHTNAELPRFLAYRCVGQAFVSGLVFAAIIVYAATHWRWDTWAHVCLVWAITPLVCLVHDFVVMGICFMGLPIHGFTTRSERPIDRRGEQIELRSRPVVAGVPTS